jgi:hypothetical protein
LVNTSSGCLEDQLKATTDSISWLIDYYFLIKY